MQSNQEMFTDFFPPSPDCQTNTRKKISVRKRKKTRFSTPFKSKDKAEERNGESEASSSWKEQPDNQDLSLPNNLKFPPDLPSPIIPKTNEQRGRDPESIIKLELPKKGLQENTEMTSPIITVGSRNKNPSGNNMASSPVLSSYRETEVTSPILSCHGAARSKTNWITNLLFPDDDSQDETEDNDSASDLGHQVASESRRNVDLESRISNTKNCSPHPSFTDQDNFAADLKPENTDRKELPQNKENCDTEHASTDCDIVMNTSVEDFLDISDADQITEAVDKDRERKDSVNDSTIDWSILFSTSRNNDASTTPQDMRIAASLGCSGTPVQWESKFETPVMMETGRLNSNNPNTIEKIYQEETGGRGSSRPPSRNIFKELSKMNQCDQEHSVDVEDVDLGEKVRTEESYGILQDLFEDEEIELQITKDDQDAQDEIKGSDKLKKSKQNLSDVKECDNKLSDDKQGTEALEEKRGENKENVCDHGNGNKQLDQDLKTSLGESHELSASILEDFFQDDWDFDKELETNTSDFGDASVASPVCEDFIALAELSTSTPTTTSCGAKTSTPHVQQPDFNIPSRENMQEDEHSGSFDNKSLHNFSTPTSHRIRQENKMSQLFPTTDEVTVQKQSRLSFRGKKLLHVNKRRSLATLPLQASDLAVTPTLKLSSLRKIEKKKDEVNKVNEGRKVEMAHKQVGKSSSLKSLPSDDAKLLKDVTSDQKDLNKDPVNNCMNREAPNDMETNIESFCPRIEESTAPLKDSQNFPGCENESNDQNFIGFTSAAGNKLVISGEAMEAAKRRLGIEHSKEKPRPPGCLSSLPAVKSKSVSEVTATKRASVDTKINTKSFSSHEMLKPNKSEQLSGVLGFSTASGKRVQISKGALEKANVSFGSLPAVDAVSATGDNFVPEDQFKLHSINQSSKMNVISSKVNEGASGFTTASGKSVKVSEKALEQAKIKMKCSSDQVIGFQAASGRSVSVSEQAMVDAKIKMGVVTTGKQNSSADEKAAVHKTVGFQTASGKSVAVSDEAISKAKARMGFSSCQKQDPEQEKVRSGFHTASGKSVNVSEEAITKASCKMGLSFPGSSSMGDANAESKNVGFQTASGKSVVISEASLAQARSKLNIDRDSAAINPIKKVSHGFKSTESLNSTINSSNTKFITDGTSSENFAGFITASGKSVDVSEDALKQARLKLGIETNTPGHKHGRTSVVGANNATLEVKSKPVAGSSTFSCGFMTASGSKVAVSEKAIKEAKMRMESAVELTGESDVFNQDVGQDDVDIKLQRDGRTTGAESSLKSQGDNPESEQQTEYKFETMDFSFDDNWNVKETKDENQGDDGGSSPILSQKKRKLTQHQSLDKNKKLKLDLDEDDEMTLVCEREEMRRKQEVLIKQKQKQIIRPIPGELTTFKKEHSVDRILLRAAPVSQYTPSKLAAGVTYDTSGDIRLPCDPKSSKVLRLSDGAWVVPGNDDCVGLKEMEQGFLAMPGVDPKLIHSNWISNHFRMIVWSLASLERKGFAESSLSLVNIMSRLKYRYDREIDGASRPVLRRICEKDDTSTRSMILLVTSVNLSQCTLQLSDGWYSLPARIQPGDPLTDIIHSAKIKEGTKLICQNMNLVGGGSGFSPLEATGSEYLELGANCCRRAVWWARLGPCPPLVVPLSSLKSEGGTAPVVKVIVARVYPLLYCLKTNGKIEYLSEKEWRTRLEKTREEHTLSQHSHTARPNNKKPLSIKELKNLEKGEDLVIELENDPSVWEILSEDQRKEAINFKEQKMAAARLEKRKEASEMENLRPVLKVRVCDINCDNQENSLSGLVTVWNPGSLTEVLLEGKTLAVSGLQVKRICEGTVHLSSVKTSRFIDVKTTNKTLPNVISRRLTNVRSILEPDFSPLFREVDIVLYVIKVSETLQSGFSDVEVCDETGCVQVRVWRGLQAAGLQSLLSENNIVAFTNLDWRNDKVPSLYVTQSTVVTARPRQEAHMTAISNLRNFVESSADLVEEYRSEFNAIKMKAVKSRPIRRPSAATSMDPGTPMTPLGSGSGVTPVGCGTPVTPQSRGGSRFGSSSLLSRSIASTPSSGWNTETVAQCKQSRLADKMSKLDAYTDHLARMSSFSSPATPGYAVGTPLSAARTPQLAARTTLHGMRTPLSTMRTPSTVVAGTPVMTRSPHVDGRSGGHAISSSGQATSTRHLGQASASASPSLPDCGLQQESALSDHIRGRSLLSVPYRPPRRSVDSSSNNREKDSGGKPDNTTAQVEAEQSPFEKATSEESQELESIFSDLMDQMNV